MCFLGLHKWSVWGCVERANVGDAKGVAVQYRHCLKCRKADWRRI
jgi:hypothetical protein